MSSGLFFITSCFDRPVDLFMSSDELQNCNNGDFIQSNFKLQEFLFGAKFCVVMKLGHFEK
jgi:hypothetical protein